MNRLTNKAPCALTVNGADYRINTDFRACLLTIAAIEDAELTQEEKAWLVLSNTYGEEERWPDDLAEAVKQALWFLNGGREHDGKQRPKLFDWEFDAERIHSAILTRGVNLDTIEGLHWWTFMSYVYELPSDSSFVQIIHLRDQKLRGKLTKEERKICDRIGWDVINLPSKDVLDDEAIWKALKGEA